MRTDARTSPQGNPSFVTPRGRGAGKRCVSVFALCLCLAVPLAQTATAAEIYARAIGDEYLPAKPPASAPPQTETKSVPDLPALGTGQTTPARAEGMSVWSKVLIGVVVVGAIAALGGHGGGGEGNVTMGGSAPSSSPAPAPSAPAPAPAPSPTTPSGGSGTPLPLPPLPPEPDGGGKKGPKH